jgi:hypothetical protein
MVASRLRLCGTNLTSSAPRLTPGLSSQDQGHHNTLRSAVRQLLPCVVAGRLWRGAAARTRGREKIHISDRRACACGLVCRPPLLNCLPVTQKWPLDPFSGCAATYWPLCIYPECSNSGLMQRSSRSYWPSAQRYSIAIDRQIPCSFGLKASTLAGGRAGRNPAV